MEISFYSIEIVYGKRREDEMLLNPFYLFSIIWGITLILYNFRVSKLFPKLTLNLLLFIVFSIFFCIVLGTIYNKKIRVNKKNRKINKKFGKEYTLIFFMFIIEFMFEKKIPLIETMNKTGYTYMDFKGIPVVHVVLFTYNFYITICTFYNYQLTKKKKYIFYSIIGVIPYILLYLRGTILLLLISFFLIILYFKYNIKMILKITFIFIFIIYIFGVAGNIRHYYSWNDSRMIKKIAIIDLPKNNLDPFIWGYVYLVSPLGNLQYNVNKTIPKDNLAMFIFDNFFFDAISKRIEYISEKPKLMVPHLTVSSFYIKAYLSYGMIGMLVILFTYMVFELIYLSIIKNTQYWVIGLSIINVLNIFSVFSNMFVFSGFSFILVYILIDIIKYKIKGD